ncbi:MAG: recombinase family protein [Armatimonadetes bacterium]|nr:recombinase family protein [Armatimonadota bacterium]
MNNRPLVFLTYARKSSVGKSKQVESIADQETIFRDIQARDSLRIVRWLNESRSAKKPDQRPVYKELVDLLRAGKANSILVWHVNRLARNPKEAGELQQLLHDGVIQCIKTPERDYFPEDHALLFAVEAAMATQYTRDLRRDVRRGTDEKAARGWYPHKPKEGYIVDPFTKEVLPDPQRFPLLRRAIELLVTGETSVPQALRQLNAMGYRTQRTVSGGNKPLSRSSFYRMINDPFYMGVFRYRGEQIQGKHQPLLSKIEFSRIRQNLGRSLVARERKHFHPYAGLAVCGVCGCLITAETHTKKTGAKRSYTYYHCTGRKGCPKTSIDEESMKVQILSQLDQCRLDPAFVDWALGVLEREGADQRKLEQVVEETTSGAESLVRRRLESLQVMREDGEVSREEYLERKAKYQAEIEDYAEKRLAQVQKVERDRETLKNILVFCRDAYDRFTHGDQYGRKAIVREFSNIYVLTQGVLRISLHPALDRIRRFEPSKNRNLQVATANSDAGHPCWRAMLDAIRTDVVSHDKGFPIDTYVW